MESNSKITRNRLERRFRGDEDIHSEDKEQSDEIVGE
jgi:hypothetical protein